MPLGGCGQTVCALVFGKDEADGAKFEFTQELVDDIVAARKDFLTGTKNTPPVANDNMSDKQQKKERIVYGARPRLSSPLPSGSAAPR